MTQYEATGLAEGFIEGSPEAQLKAWAYLIRTGTCWKLQGRFGRVAQSFIDDGLINEMGVIL